MFGRPISIASNHFNTRLPSYCDPNLDKSGRLYLPNLALFKLAHVLGDIMNDAVSFQPVKYSSVQENDRKLTKWLDDLPPELDLDDYRVTRSLGSPITSVRRLGVQSVIIRTAYHHIRFTLHRPYATVHTSLNIAVNSASQLIALVGQTRPDFLSNSALAVPGHMNWGPFHVFSAAMFFSFQLISHPDQPAANTFRENIKKATACLEQSRWMPVADKALTILQALAPLYSDEFAAEPPHERKRKKAQVLNLVKTLAFPYQDNPTGKGESSAGSSPSLGMTPTTGESPSSSQFFGPMQKQTHTQIPVSSVRWTPPPTTVAHIQHQQQQQQQQQQPPQQQPQPQPQPQPQQQQPQQHGHMDPGPSSLHQILPNGVHPQQQQQQQQQQLSPIHTFPNTAYGLPPPPPPPPATSNSMQDGGFYMQPPADEGSMWGASVGFGLGEWAQFLNVMQQPDDRMRRLLNK